MSRHYITKVSVLPDCQLSNQLFLITNTLGKISACALPILNFRVRVTDRVRVGMVVRVKAWFCLSSQWRANRPNSFLVLN